MPVNIRPRPVPSSRELYNWATKLMGYLEDMERELFNPSPKVVQLEHRRIDAKATTDGLMMWCPVTGAPIVAKDGQWYPLQLGAALPIVGIKKNG